MSLLILCLSSLATTVDSAGRVASTNPQVPTESSTTNVSSDYASLGQLYYYNIIMHHHLIATGYASNIDDDTAELKSLPVKNVESSNVDIKGWLIHSKIVIGGTYFNFTNSVWY